MTFVRAPRIRPALQELSHGRRAVGSGGEDQRRLTCACAGIGVRPVAQERRHGLRPLDRPRPRGVMALRRCWW